MKVNLMKSQMLTRNRNNASRQFRFGKSGKASICSFNPSFWKSENVGSIFEKKTIN
jgi:hypothetical protein